MIGHEDSSDEDNVALSEIATSFTGNKRTIRKKTSVPRKWKKFDDELKLQKVD